MLDHTICHALRCARLYVEKNGDQMVKLSDAVRYVPPGENAQFAGAFMARVLIEFVSLRMGLRYQDGDFTDKEKSLGLINRAQEFYYKG